MSDYITTYTGEHFIPTAPEKDKLHIKDIAHALSMICRGNGHVKTFFSVGQHCINCALEAAARGYSQRVILACLLHDASEAYMSDVPKPFKKYIADYNTMEDNLLNVIYEKYLGSALSSEEQALVKQIDTAFLYYDLLYLLNEKMDVPKPEINIRFSYDVEPFKVVEEKYLELYAQYELIKSPTKVL